MENPSPISQSSNSSSSSSTTANGLHHHHPPSSAAPPPSPTPITRSEPNSPYPTTFVQADTSSFKQVVQMLTGSTDKTRLPTRPDPARNHIPSSIKTGPRKDKSGSKLYERRNSLKNFRISPLGPGLVSTRPGSSHGYSGSPRPEILSPSILDFPSLVLSPVTPLIPDPFNRGVRVTAMNSDGNMDSEAEEKAIKERGFYLHPSPRANTPTDLEPRLLPLFPVTSPRASCSSNAADS